MISNTVDLKRHFESKGIISLLQNSIDHMKTANFFQNSSTGLIMPKCWIDKFAFTVFLHFASNYLAGDCNNNSVGSCKFFERKKQTEYG